MRVCSFIPLFTGPCKDVVAAAAHRGAVEVGHARTLGHASSNLVLSPVRALDNEILFVQVQYHLLVRTALHVHIQIRFLVVTLPVKVRQASAYRVSQER